MWQLNGFYDTARLRGLFEATNRRASCRLFGAAPSSEQWQALMESADTLVLPRVRIALGMCENKLFQPLGGILMKFENVQRFAAIIAKDATPEALVNAGVSGEMFLLRAVEHGLAGCWVTGTYKRSLVGIHVDEGERLLGLIALGNPKEPPTLPIVRTRKDAAALAPELEQLPLALRDVVQTVRIAPSAMNLQPWRIKRTCDRSLTLSVGLAAQRLDLGIAVCHALLALGQTPATFTLSDDAQSVTIELA